jgi:hypothetical protein
MQEYSSISGIDECGMLGLAPFFDRQGFPELHQDANVVSLSLDYQFCHVIMGSEGWFGTRNFSFDHRALTRLL